MVRRHAPGPGGAFPGLPAPGRSDGFGRSDGGRAAEPGAELFKQFGEIRGFRRKSGVAGPVQAQFGRVGFVKQGSDRGALQIVGRHRSGGHRTRGHRSSRSVGGHRSAGGAGRTRSRTGGPGQDVRIGRHLAGHRLRSHLDHRLVAVAGEETGDAGADDAFRGHDAGGGAVLLLRLAADLLKRGALKPKAVLHGARLLLFRSGRSLK
ncbi:hypothetical protein ACOM2C_15915 [Pseudarthrobacter sp. So.54]